MMCICRFYANGRHILSAGQDRAFRLFSVVQVHVKHTSVFFFVSVTDTLTWLYMFALLHNECVFFIP